MQELTIKLTVQLDIYVAW